MDIYKWYEVERWLYLHNVPLLPMCIKGANRILCVGNTLYSRYREGNAFLDYQV